MEKLNKAYKITAASNILYFNFIFLVFAVLVQSKRRAEKIRLSQILTPEDRQRAINKTT